MNTNFFLVRIFFIAVVLVLGTSFSACSDDDDNIGSENAAVLRLIASKSKIVPLENIKVSIDLSLDVLKSNYDSISWKAAGTAYFPFSNEWHSVDDGRDMRITDYRFGKHQVHVIGYRDGIVVSEDSLEYEVVKPTGDFMNFTWRTSTKNQYLSYTNWGISGQYNSTIDKYGGMYLTLNHIVENTTTEYANMGLGVWMSNSFHKIKSKSSETIDLNDMDWFVLGGDDLEKYEKFEQEYTFFHNYLVGLYGLPQLVYNGDNLAQTTLKEEYARNFNHKLQNNFYPIEIWITNKSVICLVQANNHIKGSYRKGICEVIAEPRKR